MSKKKGKKLKEKIIGPTLLCKQGIGRDKDHNLITREIGFLILGSLMPKKSLCEIETSLCLELQTACSILKRIKWIKI
jgi:hypothetical protein